MDEEEIKINMDTDNESYWKISDLIEYIDRETSLNKDIKIRVLQTAIKNEHRNSRENSNRNIR